VGPDGSIFMIEWHGYQIYRYSPDGVLRTTWGSVDFSSGHTNNLYGIAFDRGGQLLVTDAEPHRVVKFAATGQVIEGGGEAGPAAGEVELPWGIAVGSTHHAYVVDSIRDRVLHFDPR